MKRYLILIIFLLAMTELISWIGLSVLDRVMPETEIIPRTARIYEEQTEKALELLDRFDSGRHIIDSELGWTYRPGQISADDHITEQGLRGNRLYSDRAHSGVLRVAAYGDSFTYGSEVSNEHAWTYVLEQVSSDIEVLNYGVPGFGTDQAYLRYLREQNSLSPSAVLICFAPVDLGRSVNVYRRFISTRELPLSKPRYMLDGNGELQLLPSPLSNAADYRDLVDNPALITEFGEYDYWYSALVYENPLYDWSATVRLLSNIWLQLDRKLISDNRLLHGDQFNRESEAFVVQTAILRQFYDDVIDSGQKPIILLFPGLSDVANSTAGTDNSYAPLIDYLQVENMQYVDAIEPLVRALSNHALQDLFAPGGHYSEIGNRMVAHFLADRLADENLVPSKAAPADPLLSTIRER